MSRLVPLALAALAACRASASPTLIVAPNLANLPPDEKVPAMLATAGKEPPPLPEARKAKPLTAREKQAVKIGASAAAVVGWLFSTSSNTTIGPGLWIDDTGTAYRSRHGKPPPAPPPIVFEPADLVPWIKLAPPRQP